MGGGNRGQLQGSGLHLCDSVKVVRLQAESHPVTTSLVRKDFPLPQDSVQLLQVVHSSIGIRGKPGKNMI